MKYKNLGELLAAYNSGELGPEKCELWLDNSESFAHDYSKSEEGEQVYLGPGKKELCEEALSLLDLPWRNV